MNSRVGSRATHAPAEFTAHAAVHLKRHYRNSPFRVHDDTARPLLDSINKIGYERLKHIVHKTFPKCDIINIHRVNAPQIYGMYLLRKEEMRLANGGYDAQELVLYHVTSKSRALESLKNGLDWRLTKRAKFGCGVSFSNDVDYGNYYANRSSNEGVRVIVMSTVLINDTPYLVTEKLDRKNRLIIPPGTADTTVSPNGYVFVKYTDFESYPLFFIYYRWTPELFNESKYFNAITKNNNNNKKKKNNNNNNNNNHQRLQQEDTLCRQVANLLIGESSSQHVAAKATAAKPPIQSRNSTKKRRYRRCRAAAKLAEANANDPQPKPTLSDQNFKQATPPRRSRRSRRASKQRRRSLSRQSKMMIEVPFDYYM